jgi:hypothetical protein
MRERIGWLLQITEDLNLFHILLVLYAVPIVLGFIFVSIAFVALAIADTGFAMLLLLTVILGMILALPTALRS